MSLQQVIFNKCYEYIINHAGIPYIYVSTLLMVEQDLVPYADANHHITLNINMAAVEHFVVDKEGIQLSLKFRGQSVHTHIPYMAIRSIYNKNNVSMGMLFNNGFIWTAVPTPTPPPITTPVRKKPTLTLVK